MSFTVATYNILAQAYVRPGRYADIPPAALAPETRRPLLLRRVAGLGADLLCLQEVELDVFWAMADHLRPLGYEAHRAPKVDGQPDGCAAYVRRAAFTVREVRTLAYRDGRGTARDSGYVAQLLHLEWDGRPLCVANTHLKWDPPDTPPADQLTGRQLAQLLAERAAFAPRCPSWICCGDFNVTPDSATARAAAAAGLRDAHAGRAHAATYNRDGDPRRLDFLWHTPDLHARPVDPPAMDSHTSLPSADEPSDHLPLAAGFTWAESA